MDPHAIGSDQDDGFDEADDDNAVDVDDDNDDDDEAPFRDHTVYYIPHRYLLL